MHHLLHWLAVHTGSDHTAGNSVYYNFFSGSGSDIGELAIVGGLVGIYRRHNCHQRWCWRIARHPHGPYFLCSKHHPLVPDKGPTAAHIKEVK